MKLLSNRLILLLALAVQVPALQAQPAVRSLSLAQALGTARENNPFLKSQALNIGIAQADVVTAKLRPNPVLNNQSLQLLQTTHFEPGTTWLNGKNQQTWWQLTRSFQLGGQRSNKIDAAEKNVSISRHQLAEAERNLFLEVGLKWLDVWGLQKQVEILGSAKDNVDSLVSINRNRLKNQVITQTDLTRAELLASQYDVQLKSILQDYQNELTSFRTILGETSPVGIDTTETFKGFDGQLEADSLIARSTELRSDIQLLKSRIEAAQVNIRLQKSLAIPQPEIGLIYNPQNSVKYLGLFATIELPVFARNQGEIQKSAIIKSQAEQDLVASGSLVSTEIITAARSYRINQDNIARFGELLAKADQILASVRYAYLRGGTTIIDLLEAQRSWLDTRQQYYQVLQQYRQSYLRLMYASGLINQLAN